MGLLKTAAKVAVASSVHGRIQRRQQQRWAAQDAAAAQAAGEPYAPHAVPPQAAPPPAPAAAAGQPDMGERLNQLTRLGDLLQAGVLTEAEFQEQKNRILHG
jgi:hypothetical protein